MAQTVSPAITTGAFPSITVNSIRYAVYKETDPNAIFASQTYSTPHPERTVMFPGLFRTNYKVRVQEMSGSTIVREIGKFDIVPDNNDIKYHAPAMIEVDVTVGVSSTPVPNTTFTMDGTGGTEDWRGYDIYPERVGSGTMKPTIDFLWNKVTGTFTLQASGDALQPNEFYNIVFGLITNASTGVPNVDPFTSMQVITGTYPMTSDDIGKKLIIKGASPYFVITLPDIDTVTSGRLTYFESGIGAQKCVRIKTTAGQVIDWLQGGRSDLKMGVCETLEIYKHVDGSTAVWRVNDSDGNFKTVGEIVPYDTDATEAFNVEEMDGGTLDVNQYARVYEDYVLLLPVGRVVDFSIWSANKTKWSTSSGGVFHKPDRRNLYQRYGAAGEIPGTYKPNAMKDHKHEGTTGELPITLFGKSVGTFTRGNYGSQANGKLDFTSTQINIDGSAVASSGETLPETYITKHFFRT